MTEYTKPDIGLLRKSPARKKMTPEEFDRHIATLQKILESYGIRGKVTYTWRNPTVTNYTFLPAVGVRIEDIRARTEDIARALETDNRIMITQVFRGASEVNIAIPNNKHNWVHLGDYMRDDKELKINSLAWYFGIDLNHDCHISELGFLCDMEHVLISGCPETGKSSLLRSLVLSALYTCGPDMCQLVLIDTKDDTFLRCDGVPHLVMPVAKTVTDGDVALKFAQNEIKKRLIQRHPIEYEIQPRILVVIDEVADLMDVSHDKLKYIAQFGARVNVNLVVATRYIDAVQTIAPYIPTRMVFRTCTREDSIQCLRAPGAENLLDYDDMLMSDKQNDLKRIHTFGTGVIELSRVVYSMTHRQKTAEDKALFERAKECVLREDNPTISYLQRSLTIDHDKASELMEWLEVEGVVSEPDENGERYVWGPEYPIEVNPTGDDE
ncbi:MAG: FtsK/SpoIIIE domain-containing protein [Muribaculaceae bacterium]|nr:FtsK/SpoIIIE domain-containing protein [Muribaculaceae bacterium]MCM1441637.1 FtsK/SpoIIIE domain-containing protein [Roseburia sp.]